MKQGGQSWGVLQAGVKGVQTILKCNYCDRRYKVEWARNNHQKLCKEFNKNEITN